MSIFLDMRKISPVSHLYYTHEKFLTVNKNGSDYSMMMVTTPLTVDAKQVWKILPYYKQSATFY